MDLQPLVWQLFIAICFSNDNWGICCLHSCWRMNMNWYYFQALQWNQWNKCTFPYLWRTHMITSHDMLNEHCSYTGRMFWLVPPRNVLSMELVPPNRELLLSSPEMTKIPTRKLKVQVKICQTFTFCWHLSEKLGCVRLWLEIFFFSCPSSSIPSLVIT